jgi:hypothetical protein
MKLLFFPIFFLLFAGAAINTKAQEYAYQRLQPNDASDTLSNNGNIRVIQDPRVDSILKMNHLYNLSQNGIMGYRVQIFFDAGNFSLEKATTAAKNFQELFPGDTAYISFTEPYYRVRVGDFRTRLEARAYMEMILKEYPNAFVIRDKIRFRFDEK